VGPGASPAQLRKTPMNQGFLHMMVMQQLMEEPTSGYTLVKVIQERTGWKPSYGSIYPLLEKLQQDGYVKVTEQGRSKLYELTPTGKATFAEQKSRRMQAHDHILEQMKVLHTLGDEQCGAMIKILSNLKETNRPFKEIPESALVQQEMLRLVSENKLQANEKKLRSLFAKMYNELQKL
jgi:DNA-binding PadR family transcriptional regulator